MSEPTLQQYLEVAIRLAKDAGAMMISTSGKNTQIDEKANFRDLVTETDKAIEEYVFSSLKKAFPHCATIGEETYQGSVEWDDRPTFIVDPIDVSAFVDHSIVIIRFNSESSSSMINVINVINQLTSISLPPSRVRRTTSTKCRSVAFRLA